VALREDGSSTPALTSQGPSASEQAAAAVGARLEAILPDEAAVAQTPIQGLAAPVQDLVLPEPPVLAAAAPSPFLYPTPEPLTVAEPIAAPFHLAPEEPIAEPAFKPPPPVVEPAAAAEPGLFETARATTTGSLFNLGGFSTSGPVDLEPQDVAFAHVQPHAFGGVSLLVSLGLLGLALFGGGILWNLSVGANEGLSLIKMFGWGSSVIGMICFATSAYLLMRRLGDPEPEDED
jgi:lysozyme